jgi:hypothetical protein
MDMPGYYTFHVAASPHHLCEGPPNIFLPGAGLEGSFWVNPLS